MQIFVGETSISKAWEDPFLYRRKVGILMCSDGMSRQVPPIMSLGAIKRWKSSSPQEQRPPPFPGAGLSSSPSLVRSRRYRLPGAPIET
jgi:hypothetical protein